MKKILVLVASETNLPAIIAAKKKGFYVITCDNNPDNPGHKLADENLLIDVYDYEKIINTLKDTTIDAVITFVSSRGLKTASKVAEYFNLKGYSTNTFEILTNKAKFREFLKQYDLDHPTFEYFGNETEIASTTFTLPVIVKPTDSGGSQGVTKVNSVEQLSTAFSKAKKASKEGKVIIEEFIESDELINGDCLIYNKKIIAHIIGDYAYDTNLSEVLPIATVFPSKHKITKTLDQLGVIIDKLDIPNGIINFEAILKDDNSYIVEINPRPSGNYIWKLLEKKYNISIPDLLIDILTNEGNGINQKLAENNYGYAYQLIYAAQDKNFSKFEIPESIESSIIDLKLFYKKGDLVSKFNTLYDRAGIALLEFKNEQDKNNYTNCKNSFKI